MKAISGLLLLLDTNIAIQLIRGKDVGARIDAELGLRMRPERSLICVVTVGEALGVAYQRQWGQEKTLRLEELLSELVVVDISRPAILRQYADLQAFLVGKGRSCGENDVWIEATAAVTGATLLTTDKDFDPLRPRHLRRVLIDAKTGEALE